MVTTRRLSSPDPTKPPSGYARPQVGCFPQRVCETVLPMNSYSGPPMTLGAAAAAQVRLIVWCKACQYQVEPDPGDMAARYDADTSVLDWRERLV